MGTKKKGVDAYKGGGLRVLFPFFFFSFFGLDFSSCVT